MRNDAEVEQWGVFEATLEGEPRSNPFRDLTLSVSFLHGHRSFRAEGFYDGNGKWCIRCMPDAVGEWSWSTRSDLPSLDGRKGTFRCVGPGPANHGPVQPTNTWHFCYADGTPYLPFGTTCYAWTHQGNALEEQTLQTLRASPFNKVRMCLFPKDYLFNANEPEHHPFDESLAGVRDFTRPNPQFFRHLEGRIADLRDLGIEADLILFHPYDRWGYAAMGAENDDAYLRYAAARLAPFRNVWWSLANEYDLMTGKSAADWDRLFKIVQERDPYAHPRSIHNCRGFYDHTRPWVTHASVQHGDLVRVTEWREQYRKPIVVDECCYEGNISRNWGNIGAREMSHRVWEGTLRGGWVGHGETYLHPEDILWWSKGGVLRGQSPARIAFLRSVLEQAPPCLAFTDRFGRAYPALHQAENFFLVYVGIRQPAEMELALPDGREYEADLIDTWEMQIRTAAGRFRGHARVPMPGSQFMAIRLRAT